MWYCCCIVIHVSGCSYTWGITTIIIMLWALMLWLYWPIACHHHRHPHESSLTISSRKSSLVESISCWYFWAVTCVRKYRNGRYPFLWLDVDRSQSLTIKMMKFGRDMCNIFEIFYSESLFGWLLVTSKTAQRTPWWRHCASEDPDPLSCGEQLHSTPTDSLRCHPSHEATSSWQKGWSQSGDLMRGVASWEGQPAKRDDLMRGVAPWEGRPQWESSSWTSYSADIGQRALLMMTSPERDPHEREGVLQC